jgi:aminoglycoside phosphotransferase (APT) family kinase protein
MTRPRMHPDELDIDEPLVRRLMEAQFPQWANLPLDRVQSDGTDNAIFRLGDTMSVRLPRIGWATGQVDKEHEWLPRLAPRVPLTIPVPIARGMPGEGYPWRWSVSPWIQGENATPDRIDLPQAALDLAEFVNAMWQIDTAGGPEAGPNNFGRGVPLANRDESFHNAIAAVASMDIGINTALATEIWEDALQQPAWDGDPVWLHGDIQHGNLLAVDGRITSIIDFGCLGIGDPAADLTVAWNLLDAGSRAIFREVVDVDDATWARGRGWAISLALGTFPYYLHTNPTLTSIAWHSIEQVFQDVCAP